MYLLSEKITCREVHTPAEDCQECGKPVQVGEECWIYFTARHAFVDGWLTTAGDWNLRHKKCGGQL